MSKETFSIEPIGVVQSTRKDIEDDYWGDEVSCISLTSDFSAESLQGLTAFSHIEVLYLFHTVLPEKIVTAARHPRNNPAWPAVGIFAQRGKNRPNRLGATICKLIRVEGTKLYVNQLDAIDETPVIDIKPVMREFLPREEIQQPDWASELMNSYWLIKS